MNSFTNTLKESSLFRKGLLKFDYPLKNLTCFKIGGNAEFFFTPSTEEELKTGLELFKKNNIPVSIIGGGSNLLVSDSGIKGAVIKLEKFDKIEIIKKTENDVFIRAGAGVLTDYITKWAAENGISGLEDFGGLPGTLGGAAFMNARCYEKSISDIFCSAKVLYFDNLCYIFDEYKSKQEEWDYKVSPFQKYAEGIKIISGRKLIVSLTFKLCYGKKEEIKNKTQQRIDDRTRKGHFLKPSAGSVFKNNRKFGKPSGKLIEEAGLKGISDGDAQIAPWHGNFIINNCEAKAENVRKLIEKIQKIVFEKQGFLLEPEIFFAGFDE